MQQATAEPTRLELIEDAPATGGALAHHQAAAVALPENSPAAMMMAAVSRGMSLEQVGQMMDLQDRYNKAEAQKAYSVAFAAFKDEAVRIIKNRDVKDGPLKGKAYAELHAVVNAVTPALSKHGLSASWKLTKDERDWIEVTCTLKHSAGHSESVSMGGPPDTGGAKNAIQARASTVSYLERYTLKAILGVAEQGQDDDGAGGKDGAAADPILDGFRAAAMNGEKALRAHYEANKPTEEFWKLHARSLKAAAAKADGREVGQ
jgi:hypothetical protein